MKKLSISFFAILFLLAACIGVAAQSAADKKAVADVVDQLFAKMAAAEPEAIRALQTPQSQIVAVARGKDKKNHVQTYSAEAFSKFFTNKDAKIEERMYAPKTEIDGDVAMYWGRYVFFAGGKLSHCGLNTFHLVRDEGVWKIAGAASTIDPDSCTKKEKAMKPSVK
jgi:hypothetical protein